VLLMWSVMESYITVELHLAWMMWVRRGMISSGLSKSWIKLARFGEMTAIIYQRHSRNPEVVIFHLRLASNLMYRTQLRTRESCKFPCKHLKTSDALESPETRSSLYATMLEFQLASFWGKIIKLLLRNVVDSLLLSHI
jgi:hypothetical protein